LQREAQAAWRHAYNEKTDPNGCAFVSGDNSASRFKHATVRGKRSGMVRERIAGLNRLTKKQRVAIGQLGSEWAVLDSAESLILKMVKKQYQALRSEERQSRELVELEREQKEIFNRKREISADLLKLESGVAPRRRPPGRRSKAAVSVRNMVIRASEHRLDKDISRELDFHLAQRNMPPLGFPESWTEKYGVTSYYEAYRHPKSKPLVQKLISAAKAA
jgi:hypothetical protein